MKEEKITYPWDYNPQCRMCGKPGILKSTFPYTWGISSIICAKNAEVFRLSLDGSKARSLRILDVHREQGD